MPRLVGKRSNPAPALTVIILAAIAAGVSLEYFGYINVVPRFGRTAPYPIDRTDRFDIK